MTQPIRSMPEVTADFYAIRVAFDGLVQAHIRRADFLGYHSWTDHAASFSVEYAFKGGTIVTEYSDRERWAAVLQGLEGCL